MTPLESLEGRGRARDNAVRRLRRAREQLAAAKRRRAHSASASTELAAEAQVGECSAAVANREQWLHWIDHRETIRPEADGEWGREGHAREDMPPSAGPRVRGNLTLS
jgi:hypothetical protein